MTERDAVVEARAEIARALEVLAFAPGLAERRGWEAVEAAARSLPETVRAGFLSHHPFDVARTEALLALDPAELAALPPSLARPLACASFLHHLALCGWEEAHAEWGRLQRAIEAATWLREPADRARFEARLPGVEARLHAPQIPDGWLEVPGLPRVHCSFAGSVEALRTVAASHRAGAPWVVSFGHPFSLWMAARDAYDTAFERSTEAGKWNVEVPTLDEAARVARALVPAFERGEARLGKVLLCEAAVGGTSVLLYCSRPDETPRRLLDEAAGRASYYVYDSDCGEGAALRRMVRLAAKSRGASASGAAAARPDLAGRVSGDFGAALELSDVQRRILRTGLERGVTPVPDDGWTRLVLTYLDGLGDEVASFVEALGEPEFVARISSEALDLQKMERRKTGSPPRALKDL